MAMTAAIEVFKFFITIPFWRSVKELDDVRKDQRNQDEHGNCDKKDLVDATCRRHCTYVSWTTNLRRSKDLPSRKGQSDKSARNEKRTVRFESGQVSDPRAAQAQRYENQRSETTSRSENSC